MRREIIVLLVFVIVVAAAWWWTNSKPEDSKPKCPNCTYGCIPTTSRCREPPCPSNCTLGCIQGTTQCKSKPNVSNSSNVSVTPKLNKITACGVVNQTSQIGNDIRSDGTCLTFSNDSITLDCNDNLIIGNNNPDSYGIYIKNRKNITLRNCIVTNYSSGIIIDSSSGIYIYGSNIRGNTYAGIIVNSSRNTLLSETFASENELGFLLSYSKNVTLNKSGVSPNTIGIKIESCEDVRLFNTAACDSLVNDFVCDSSVISANSGTKCKINSGCDSIICYKCQMYEVPSNASTPEHIGE